MQQRPNHNPRYGTPTVAGQLPVPPAASGRRKRPPLRKRRRPSALPTWVIATIVMVTVMVVLTCSLVTIGAMALYMNGNVLPGVQVAGIPLGGLSETEAVATLQSEWEFLVLDDGEQRRSIDASRMGMTLNAAATANKAVDYGRSTGGVGGAMMAALGTANIAPVVSMDWRTARDALYSLEDRFGSPPLDAGVRLVDGEVVATPPQNGMALDVEATLALVQQNPQVLADGVLELVMVEVQPHVTDAAPMVEQARQLLNRPLRIYAYDPVSGDDVDVWSIYPTEWSNWITATPAPDTATGLALTIDTNNVEAFVREQAAALGDGRRVDVDETVTRLRQAVENGVTDVLARIYHDDRQHTVAPGESITDIAWDYGVPYPYIQEANPGIGDTLSVGQTITIPSPDTFLPYPVVFDKRIVVSISQQRVWVYEDDNLKWDWAASTGLYDSPTWPGIYQIISHEENAYAGNWNLYMPYFLGVYQPIPGSDFTNGFHGFPSRGGFQLLWQNALGSRVTYGCILLSTENAQKLYEWAEEGVVVEIQP